VSEGREAIPTTRLIRKNLKERGKRRKRRKKS